MTKVFLSHAERRRFERAQANRNPGRGSWSNERIREEFDSNWNLTLRQLSKLSGRSVEEIKNILMEE